MRRALGLALAGLALLLPAGVTLQMLECGASTREAAEPGQPQRPDRCIPYVHPSMPLLLGAGALGLGLVALGRHDAAAVLGTLLAVPGFVLVFSVGVYLVLMGGLLANAGLQGARAPTRWTRPLAWALALLPFALFSQVWSSVFTVTGAFALARGLPRAAPPDGVAIA